jgi:ABC-type antimicrobial peptide transport system permease subunit
MSTLLPDLRYSSMALGAQARDVLKLIMGNGMLLAVIGVALGLGGAFAVTRVWQVCCSASPPPTRLLLFRCRWV